MIRIGREQTRYIPVTYRLSIRQLWQFRWGNIALLNRGIPTCLTYARESGYPNECTKSDPVSGQMFDFHVNNKKLATAQYWRYY